MRERPLTATIVANVEWDGKKCVWTDKETHRYAVKRQTDRHKYGWRERDGWMHGGSAKGGGRD